MSNSKDNAIEVVIPSAKVSKPDGRGFCDVRFGVTVTNSLDKSIDKMHFEYGFFDESGQLSKHNFEDIHSLDDVKFPIKPGEIRKFELRFAEIPSECAHGKFSIDVRGNITTLQVIEIAKATIETKNQKIPIGNNLIPGCEFGGYFYQETNDDGQISLLLRPCARFSDPTIPSIQFIGKLIDKNGNEIDSSKQVDWVPLNDGYGSCTLDWTMKPKKWKDVVAILQMEITSVIGEFATRSIPKVSIGK